MSNRRRPRSYDWVAIDLNTQYDFCEPEGRHPMANLPHVMPAWRRMMAWVKWHGVPLVSSMDSHRTTEMNDSGYPICCIDGSSGQRKLRFTMTRRYLCVEFDNTLAIPIDPFETHQQLLFRQRTADLLTNPKAERFLTQVPVREFLLFGNSLELAVKALALGLLTRAKNVAIVTDACGVWECEEANLAIRQLEAKGARITTVAEVTAQRPRQRIAYHRLPVLANGFPGSGHARPEHASHQPFLNGNGTSKSHGAANTNGQLPH